MNTTNTELAEPELLPAVIEESAPAALTLFGADPRIALGRMGELAEALMDVVRDRGLAVKIRQREHLTIEAWTTLGSLVGVHAAIVWTRPNESGDGIVARAEARTIAGALVGAAEGECSRAEQRWKTAEPFAVRSMAQTRAISRALQAPLRHIAVLAGYEGAAAEEMPPIDARTHRDDGAPSSETEPRRDNTPKTVKPTDDQVTELLRLLDKLGAAQPEVDWKARSKELAGTSGDMLTATTMQVLLGKLQDELAEAS